MNLTRRQQATNVVKTIALSPLIVVEHLRRRSFTEPAHPANCPHCGMSAEDAAGWAAWGKGAAGKRG